MTADTATAGAEDREKSSAAARLRGLLRRFDLTRLGLLGFLSVPAYVVESLAFLRLFGIFFLFFFWAFVGPLVDMVLARRTDEETEPTDWIAMDSTREYAVAYLMLPLAILNPVIATQDVLQLLGGGVAFLRNGGSLPDSESYEQDVSYRLPFDGTWTVVNGSPEREYSHSWIYPNQRYAYDFVITDEDGRSRPDGTGTNVENYYCYDEPVLAPADGVVVDTFDSVLESPRGGGVSHPLKRDIRGGFVVIEHAESEYSTLAHLRPGSVAVDPGERVTRGQEVGRCGHSGNSSEPHLHFQIQDHPHFAVAASLPVQFDTVTVDSPGVAHDDDLVPGYDVWHSGGDDRAESTATDGSTAQAQSGQYYDRSFVLAGQRVTHAGDATTDQSGASAERQSGVSAQGQAGMSAESHSGLSWAADTDSSSVASTARTITATFRHATFGLAVGGVLTFFGTLFVAGLTVAMVLGGAAVAGVVVYGLARSVGEGYQSRPGSLGTALGVGVAAGAVATAVTTGVGTGTTTGLLLLAGATGYLIFASSDRRLLRDLRPARSVA